MALPPYRTIKIVCVGDSGTGKSSIVQTFVNKDDVDIDQIETTVGIDFATKHVTVGSKRIKLTIWDTAGQERFRSLARSYYRGAEVLVVVYDITDEKTFENIDYWIKEAEDGLTTTPVIVLVGNKTDLEDERVVDRTRGEREAKIRRAMFIETSARTRKRITQPFKLAVKSALKRTPRTVQRVQRISLEPTPDDYVSGCCT
jgi:small GTP-binding protein